MYLVTPAGEDFDKTNVSRSHPKSHSPNLTHVDVLSPGIKNQAARQCLPMMLPANIWNNVSGWSIHQPFTVMKNRFHNPKLPSAKPCCHQSQKTSLQESLKWSTSRVFNNFLVSTNLPIIGSYQSEKKCCTMTKSLKRHSRSNVIVIDSRHFSWILTIKNHDCVCTGPQSTKQLWRLYERLHPLKLHGMCCQELEIFRKQK